MSPVRALATTRSRTRVALDPVLHRVLPSGGAQGLSPIRILNCPDGSRGPRAWNIVWGATLPGQIERAARALRNTRSVCVPLPPESAGLCPHPLPDHRLAGDGVSELQDHAEGRNPPPTGGGGKNQ